MESSQTRGGARRSQVTGQRYDQNNCPEGRAKGTEYSVTSGPWLQDGKEWRVELVNLGHVVGTLTSQASVPKSGRPETLLLAARLD